MIGMPRTIAILALGAAALALSSLIVFFSETHMHAYGLSAENTKQSFASRRAQRSWTEDTANWKDGAGQSIAGQAEKGDLPAHSTIKPSTSADTGQVGSAVAIGDNDEARFWLTARHMIAGCASIRLAGANTPGTSSLLAALPLVLHPTADLALIETAHRTGAFIVVPVVQQGDVSREAIHIGFPGGRPGAIYSDYLGLTRVRWIDSSLPTEAYRVWAERTQVPVSIAGLGGLSGGATMNREGGVIGTVVGISERRGRILSTRPPQIASLIYNQTFATERPGRQKAFDDRTFPVFARRLIEQRQVARLDCVRSSHK